MTKIVGLRELKNNLSRYVREVRAGEVLAIANRGQVIAELTPPRPKSDPKVALEDMARRGDLTWPRLWARRSARASMDREIQR